MEVISLLGITLAIGIFVFLAFKNYNLFFNAVIAAIVIVVTSNLPVLSTLKGAYMKGLAGFLQQYLFLFALSALFGKVMEDSGAVRKIAIVLANYTKTTKDKKFWTVMILPLFYFVLSYVGISGFVVVFTVVAIGRELFEEMDVPWLYYCYGSAGIYPAMVLGGSLYANNVIAAHGFKVPLTAGMGLSIVMVVVAFIVLGVLIKLDVKASEKKRECFLPSGEAIKKLQLAAPIPEEQLPALIPSLLALFIPVILIFAFSVDVLVALLGGIILAYIFGRKNIKSTAGTLTAGIVASIVPVVNVAAAAALVGVIKLTGGYKIVTVVLAGMPPMFAASTILMLIAAMIASSGSALPPLMPYLVEKMAEAGISPGVGARLMVGSCITYMVPHNPGVVNAVSLTKLGLAQVSWIYFKSTFIPGAFSLVTAFILIYLGVFK